MFKFMYRDSYGNWKKLPQSFREIPLLEDLGLMVLEDFDNKNDSVCLHVYLFGDEDDCDDIKEILECSVGIMDIDRTSKESWGDWADENLRP